MFTYALLYAGLLPLSTAALVAVIMRRFRSSTQIASPVATTAGFLTAQFTLRGQSGFSESVHTFFQPHEAVDWLPHIVLLALGVSIVMYLAPTHRQRLIALAAALCLAAPIRLLSGNVAQHWSVPVKVALLLSLAAVLAAVWLLLSSNDDKQPVLLSAALQILVAVGTAIVLTQSGALMYGLSSAALGSAIAGTALASVGATGSASALQRPAIPAIHSASGIITFTLGSLLILGHFYAELSTTNTALLFLALVATAAPIHTLLVGLPAWQQSTARVMCCLVPLGIAVVSVVA